MSEIFGLSMNVIMVVLVASFAACVVAVLGIYLSNRMMFRWGLRNIGRRRAQSSLVVAGLMLATVIITAAFSTGDTIDYSATNIAFDNLQRTDLSLHHFLPAEGAAEIAPEEGYVDEGFTAAMESVFAGDADIEGFVPFLFEPVPLLNPRTRQAEPLAMLAGIDATRQERFGGLHLVGGGRASLTALGPRDTFINQTTAKKLDARTGDVIRVFARDATWDLTVVGIVRDERASGSLEFGGAPMLGLVVPLATAQEIVGREGLIDSVNVVLYGDVRSSMKRSDSAAGRLEAFEADPAAKAAAGLAPVDFQVEKNKQDGVDGAKLASSLFTTLFLVLGLFSIAAGIMLIFTLFVMLAAERRRDMGIARAVGAQRTNLVQAFVAEGMVYDVLAGVVGVVLGVIAGAVIIVGGIQLVAGEELGWIRPHVTARTLVISFTLGAVLTFVTVVISSLRISLLTIVAAVRGQSERGRPAYRRRTRWTWVVVGCLAMVIPPLGLYFLLRKGLGIPWAWITGPAGLLVAIPLVILGMDTNLDFPLTLGVSLALLSGGTIVRMLGVRARPVWSTTGALLAVYWLSPTGWHEAVFGKTSGSMEMFVFSGIMIVSSFTMVIVFNARLLTTVFASGPGRFRAPAALTAMAVVTLAAGIWFGDAADGLGQVFFILAVACGVFAATGFLAARTPWFAPALKMAIAYPLANRFRTGMTIAMFSLVVFSITVMGILNATVLRSFATDEGRAGWDVVATSNWNNPIGDLRAALDLEGSFDTSQIAAVGRATRYDDNVQQARQAGKEEFKAYPVQALDATFLAEANLTLEGHARSFPSDEAAIAAVRTQPNTGLIDSSALQAMGFGGNPEGVHITGVKVEEGEFDAFEVDIRDAVSGKTIRITIVGVLSGRIPANVLWGIYTNEPTWAAVFGTPEYAISYLRLAPGADDRQAAHAIEAALVTQGVQADSIKETIDDAIAMSVGFLRIFQAFMGLGLFVGIASLGVIALRSVVERRQQIGMLRAIGYQRGSVAMSFMLESGFVALAGIASGVVGATILSWNLIDSTYFQGNSNVEFYVPWGEVVVYSVLAFGCALAMSWWPSRRAAAVPIAEALRYE
ncbi:MAG: ABC transporter permease [Chloroflexi bacterium]|nr:ABC transporter permease [Chloroflexota bacterium]